MFGVSSFGLAWRSKPVYGRRAPLILINGLAEQAESWYCNVAVWRRHFDVYQPNLLAYDGASLHGRIESGQPIDIDYLVEQLRRYLDEFVQTPPYHLIANSLGGKVAVQYAARYREHVDRLVLLCPSGLSYEERLPILDGVRRQDLQAIMASVFANPNCADAKMLSYYQKQFANRRWRLGLLRTIRGTKDDRVQERLLEIARPTLLVVGDQDRIVNPRQTIEAGSRLSQGRVVVLRNCGHAPQIEQADIVNRLVVDFLQEGRSHR